MKAPQYAEVEPALENRLQGLLARTSVAARDTATAKYLLKYSPRCQTALSPSRNFLTSITLLLFSFLLGLWLGKNVSDFEKKFPDVMAPRFAFLGMGGMGKVRSSVNQLPLTKLSKQAMTQNLVLYGNLDKPLTIYNRTKSHAVEHSALIGQSNVADTIEEAVQGSDIVWSCLQDEEAVESTFQEILKTNISGKLFVESSSITPDATNLIARQVLDAGGQFLAMPGTYSWIFPTCSAKHNCLVM